MSTRFSNVTWAQAESEMRSLVGTDRMNPAPVLFRAMATILLMNVWRILDGKHDWAYRRTVDTLVPKVDYDSCRLETDPDVIAALTETEAAARIMGFSVDPAEASWWVRSNGYVFRTGDRVTFIGFSPLASNLLGFRATVGEGGQTAMLRDLVIDDPESSGFWPVFTDYDQGVMTVEHSLTNVVLDISGLSLKRIISIADRSSRVWDIITDTRRFHLLSHDAAYDDQVVAHQRGDIIETYRGTEAQTILDVVMEYDGIPEAYTEATANHEIQLFQEYYVMWRDLMMGWLSDFVGKAKEADLEGRINTHLQAINDAMKQDAKDSGVKLSEGGR